MLHLKRIFPDSLTLELKLSESLTQQLWQISRLCARFWNYALERFTQQEAGSPAPDLQELKNHPDFRLVPLSSLQRVLDNLQEAFDQYHQAQQDYAASRRADRMALPGTYPENQFFPLFFSQDFLHLEAEESCLKLRYGDRWIDLELPQGNYQKIHSILIMYHPDSERFAYELNPILEDIRD